MGVRKTFIQNLKFYRKRAGLTQEKLAEAIGMSTAYIGDMEARERFPSAETIDKIAAALGIHPSTLFDDHGNPASIQSSFREEYGRTLQEELTCRLVREVEEVCSRIRLDPKSLGVLPALSPRLGNRCQQYLVPELIVPAVHRVAVHTDNFRTRRRRYVRTKASDNLPVFLCT